jgi:hypothetical protein
VGPLKQRQIDLLWQHAKNFGGIPLYSFYNGPRPSVAAWNCAAHRDDQQFGCSIVPHHIVAGFIILGRPRRAGGRKRTDFEYLHENDRAGPWRCVVCPSRTGREFAWLESLTNPDIELRGYAELPYYVQQVINTDREYVRIDEYPQSAVMFPRHVAVVSIEPPTMVTPSQLPAPRVGELSSLLEQASIAKHRRKVLA